jgi:hypothetical protein
VFDSDIGLLLTEFPGALDRHLVEKVVPPGTTIEPVTVDGAAGYWLGDGVHEFFYLDAEGNPQPDTARLAANTLSNATASPPPESASTVTPSQASPVSSHRRGDVISRQEARTRRRCTLRSRVGFCVRRRIGVPGQVVVHEAVAIGRLTPCRRKVFSTPVMGSRGAPSR